MASLGFQRLGGQFPPFFKIDKNHSMDFLKAVSLLCEICNPSDHRFRCNGQTHLAGSGLFGKL